MFDLICWILAVPSAIFVALFLLGPVLPDIFRM